eukprot:Tbor_TRINITY_DN6132_c1_g1::TRINITY_DN6132_c1_g1_i4::g.22719::m.22719
MSQFRPALLLVLLLHVSSLGVHVEGDHLNTKPNAENGGAKAVKGESDADVSVKAAGHNTGTAAKDLRTAQAEWAAKDKAAKDTANSLGVAKADERAAEV